MEINKLQIGLLKWFQINGGKMHRFESIDNICRKLYEQYFDDLDFAKAKYKIFFPLIKYGLIEFYGHKQFALSPTNCLVKDELVLFCNLPENLKKECSIHVCYDTKLGIEVYKKNNLIVDLIHKHNIQWQDFNFVNLINRIRDFDELINNWEEDTVFDTTGFYIYINGNWSPLNNISINGVYKKSVEVYSQRIIRTKDNCYYKIPTRDVNIDAFNLAVMASTLANKQNLYINYFNKVSKIKIDNINFPIIIERILFINSLLSGDFSTNNLMRNYFLKIEDFLQLNRLFKNKITVQ